MIVLIRFDRIVTVDGHAGNHPGDGRFTARERSLFVGDGVQFFGLVASHLDDRTPRRKGP